MSLVEFASPIGMTKLAAIPPGTIDGLAGTIDAQTGDINSLGAGATVVVPALMFFDDGALQLKIGVNSSSTAPSYRHVVS